MSTPDPRAEYRRRLQRRQTKVIGGTITAMLILTVVCFLLWSGVIPSPFDPGFSTPSDDATPVTQPCPPTGATTTALTGFPINVYNGTNTAGLAGGLAATLTEAGLNVANTADWPHGSYNGDILLTSSPAGIANAYSLAHAFSGTVYVSIDENAAADDPTVSIVLGDLYTSSVLSPADISQLKTGAPIPAPAQCAPVAPAAQATAAATTAQ